MAQRFSLWSFFKDLPGIKLVNSWMSEGNSVSFTISDKQMLVKTIDFFSSIGLPLKVHLKDKGKGFMYSVYVSPKEEAWFSPLMRRWLKSLKQEQLSE